MSFPKTGTFGIIDNPLIFSVYGYFNSGSGDLSNHEFLLMDGEFFLLMDGTNFLLMGS